jgi:hypothetical protein
MTYVYTMYTCIQCVQYYIYIIIWHVYACNCVYIYIIINIYIYINCHPDNAILARTSMPCPPDLRSLDLRGSTLHTCCCSAFRAEPGRSTFPKASWMMFNGCHHISP